MQPININPAESIIEPFWDPDISMLDQWSIEKKAEKASVEQTWCMVAFKWSYFKKNEEALIMSREYKELSVLNADTLIVSAALTKGVFLNIRINDREKSIKTVFICKDDKKHEYNIDISSIENITGIIIEIGSEKGNAGSGWFNWIGLADNSLLKQYLSSGSIGADVWEKHLKPMEFTPAYEPTYGILMSGEDIGVLRKMTENLEEEANPFNKIREYERLDDPESHINEYVNFFADTRYNRERDEGNEILKKGQNAAVAGIVQKDPALLRIAARYALSIASCETWDDGFICDFQTSSFNHRCFVQSLCLYECAVILDLAGEFFTDIGRDYVLRKMAEEGIGAVNFNTWKYEYIFHCNQLSWFSPGRMYGYAVLMKHYPRVEPYMDIAFNDVIENINNTVEEDGGYLEGPGYFSCIGRDALLALYIYSNSKNKKIEELIPPIMQKTVDFGEVLESTDKMIDFIPICDVGIRIKDSFVNLYKVHLAFMAYFFKDSVWPEVFFKHVDSLGLGDNPLSWLIYSKMQRKVTRIRRSFLQLDITGHTASYREGKFGISKIFIIGNKKGAGHTHMDKGSFVFEYGGETFLMDPGICSYDNPISFELKAPNRHNMLVPFGKEDIPNPENPLMVDVIAKASGDSHTFHTITDLSKTWPEAFKKWIRIIDSPTPKTLTLRDEYVLNTGEGVSVVLNSPLPIENHKNVVYIIGVKERLEIEIPDNCEVTVDKLRHPVITHNRISISKKGVMGTIDIYMRIEKLR